MGVLQTRNQKAYGRKGVFYGCIAEGCVAKEE
jgi:hypothetical protein